MPLREKDFSLLLKMLGKQGPTYWAYRLPPRTAESMKKWIPENITRCSIPINFFNERREVGKGRDIAMFGKSSIEDFVKFRLSLLLRLRIADHRQKESSDCRSSRIRSPWYMLFNRKGCKMDGLTYIRLGGNIFQQVDVLVRDVGILDIS